MEDKIPTINDADIKRIIDREFPNSKFAEIESILRLYESETKGGRNRVFASILKLANGDLELLNGYVESANNDYRDIISLAEYPNYSKCAFDDTLSDQETEQLLSKDWKQYQSWLNNEYL